MFRGEGCFVDEIVIECIFINFHFCSLLTTYSTVRRQHSCWHWYTCQSHFTFTPMNKTARHIAHSELFALHASLQIVWSNRSASSAKSRAAVLVFPSSLCVHFQMLFMNISYKIDDMEECWWTNMFVSLLRIPMQYMVQIYVIHTAVMYSHSSQVLLLFSSLGYKNGGQEHWSYTNYMMCICQLNKARTRSQYTLYLS